MSTSTTGRKKVVPMDTSDESCCHICADPEPKYWVIGQCNHRVCWQCSLRMRVLYQNRTCPMCKMPNEKIFVGKQSGYRTFEELTIFQLRREDRPLGLVLETEGVERDVKALLQTSCPHQGCKCPPFASKADLRRHVTSLHQEHLCDICLAHKKVFSSEIQLFPSSFALQRHQKEHHPTCKVCGTIFFGDDELVGHYRDKHERCHICYRRDPASQPYYRDYSSLVHSV